MSTENANASAPADFSQANREALIATFRSRPQYSADHAPMLGVEVEHFVIFDDGAPVPYYPREGRLGVRDVLEEFSDEFPERAFTSEGELIGLEGPTGSITLEPAAQIEFSIAPYASIAEVEAAYTRFRERIDAYLATRDAHLVSRGYHPTRKAFDLELIPKTRYAYMNDYFTRHIHTHGERMMRASASTQVSVDFSSEADGIRKLRVASALAPVLAAIADNTPVFEAEPNTLPVRRLALWRNVDNARCGVIPGIFEQGFSFAAYVDWLFATSPIFVTRPAASDPEGPSTRAAYDLTAAEAYADAPMTRDDMMQLGSMFWPDARLKQFVEIRPADCLPPAQVFGYAALVKGLFYSEASLAAIEARLGTVGALWSIGEADVNAAIASIEEHGLEASVYGSTLADWEAFLFELARAALPADEVHYLDALEAFAADKPWWPASRAEK